MSVFYTDLDDSTRFQIEQLARRNSVSPEKFIKELVENYRKEKGIEIGCRKPAPECSSPEVEALQIKTVAIVGPGTMGRSLSKVFSMKGYRVLLIGQTDSELDDAISRLEHNLDGMIAKWELTPSEKKVILQQIERTTDLQRVSDAQLVIEAITENLEQKKTVIKKIDAFLGPGVIVASNTSSFRITDLASEMACPQRMIGMHFLYPPSRRMVVEIVRSAFTSQATFLKAAEVVRKLGKQAVEVFESPGFITTRVSIPFINEAIHTLVEGVATAEGIDTAIKMGYNISMGPLELADTIGLDEVLRQMDYLFKETGDPKFRPNSLLRRMVREGYLGKKTGRGFFYYEELAHQAGEEH